MEFTTFSPKQLRDAIEVELQRGGDIKTATYAAMKQLKKDPQYYDMEKARIVKYIRRIPKPSGKGFLYFYNKEDYARYMKTGKIDKSEGHSKFIEAIKNFFGASTDKEVSEKVKAEYQKQGIESKFNVPVTVFTEHLAEYFTNKEAWVERLSAKKKKAEPKKKSEPKKQKKKTGSQPSQFNMSLMRYINEIYGGEKKEEPKKEKSAMSMEDLISTAKQLGTKAFKDGRSSAGVQNRELMNLLENNRLPNGKAAEIFKAFSDAWLVANLSKPMPEVAPEPMTEMVGRANGNTYKGTVSNGKWRVEDVTDQFRFTVFPVSDTLDTPAKVAAFADQVIKNFMGEKGKGGWKAPEPKKEEPKVEAKTEGKKLPSSIAWMKGKAVTTERIEEYDGKKYKIIEDRFVGSLPYRMRISIDESKFDESYHDADGNEVNERAFNVMQNRGNNYRDSRYIKTTTIPMVEDAKTPEPEKTKEEQKAKDVEVSKAINEATPENRAETERKILDIPEPTEDNQPETPKVAFKPEMVEFYFENPVSYESKTRVIALDYTAVKPVDIFLIKEKDILSKDRPSYIPEANEYFFSQTDNFFPTVKLDEDKYIMQVESKIIRKGIWEVKEENGLKFRSQNGFEPSEDKFVIVNRDTAASIQDYYIKKAKAIKKQEEEAALVKWNLAHPDKHVAKYPHKRVTMISENKMSYAQRDMMNAVKNETGGRSVPNWKHYREVRSDLKQKLSDMTIQLEEHYNAHAKGQETSYGDKGTKDNLLKDYGVKVKRQNGSEINDKEIGEVKAALDDVFSVFGNRASMAKSFGLKISHAGNVNMHARKAAGIYMPSMKAIGVTSQYGDKASGMILAHEWAHFMDNYLGDKNGRHYASDNPGHVAGKIAKVFRDNMAKAQDSDYYNRTCECFARAMEQYWAIKTDNRETLAQWDSKGTHPKEEFFTANIQPLIDQFITENHEMLKAFGWGESLRSLKKALANTK